MFSLVLKIHQAGYWKLLCCPEGGAIAQVCVSSLPANHYFLRVLFVSRELWQAHLKALTGRLHQSAQRCEFSGSALRGA